MAGVQNGGKHLTALMKIQTFIQAYVQAISSILESDVTVVDSELIRVAGTGNYAEEIGSTVAHGNFFSRILLSGEKGIITDAAKDENCIGCEKRGYCKELANLAYPIFKDGAVVGVISIIAFQEEQREYLLKNRSKLEEFLKYMCVLLESKLYTDEANDRLEQQLKIIHNAEKAWSFVQLDWNRSCVPLTRGRKIPWRLLWGPWGCLPTPRPR